MPSPVQIIAAVQELAVQGLPQGSRLLFHCLYSLERVGLGFVLALVAAIPLGILCGWSRLLRDMLTPVIETLRPIPPLAWIPLAILWFGIGLRSAAFIIFLGCFFPILLSTMSGVLSVDPVLISAAKTLGATRRQIFYKVLLPGATPSIFTGLRIGLGIGWMTLVAAEFTGVKSGYGLGLYDYDGPRHTAPRSCHSGHGSYRADRIFARHSAALVRIACASVALAADLVTHEP